MSMKALVLKPARRSTSVEDVLKPNLGEQEILVRVRSVALNHVDFMNTANPMATQEQRVLGSDFAGEVLEAGKSLAGLDDPRVQIGARVAGFLQGANSVNDRPGAFAQYLVIDYDLTWNIPGSLSFHKAASISLCGVTAAQGIFERLQLPCPFFETEGFASLNAEAEGPIYVFVHGAASSVGLYTAQFIRLAGKTSGREIRLIGAASPSKHDLLSSVPYSYDLLVDYHDSQWPETVRKFTGGDGVNYAIDAISIGSTVEQTDSVVRSGGRLAIFRAPAAGGIDVAKLKTKPIFGAVWEALGVEVEYHGLSLPANSKARAFCAALYQYLGQGAQLDHVRLHPNPIRVMPGGLERIPLDGFKLLSGGFKAEKQVDENTGDYLRPISGEKLVYTIS